ncbi:MAG: glycoside hydrolase family 44 protein [Opitutaceae bacterium]|nr:glycoside hydrolase family 44 protein [Opitutaceae bacterium]
MPPRSLRSLLALLACGLAVPLALDAAPRTPISPLLVGNNVWYHSPNAKVWELTREAGVRLLRIGGAGYDHHLPKDDTLVAWVRQIRGIGAEPLLQVSQYGGPEKAAALVALFNQRRAAGEPIRYWSIGNEPWLQNGRPDFATLAPAVADYFKKISAAMKAVDPTIKIFGPDECDLFEEFHEKLFGPELDLGARVPGKPYHYIDGLAWHRYPQTETEPGLAEIEEFRVRSRYARQIVDRVNQRHARTGDQALVWALTEFNAKGGPQVHTWGNGQMFGAIYGIAMEHGAFTAATWSMYEHGGSRTGTDFSFVDGKQLTPRPTYWHMQLVSRYFSGDYIPARSPADSLVVYGADDGKRIAVMLLNLSDREVAFALGFGGRPSVERDAVPVVLDSRPGPTRAGRIGPRSTQVLLFESGTVSRIDYTEQDFLAGRGPSSPSPVD